MSFVLKSHMVRAFRCIMLGSKDLGMWSFDQVDAKAKVIWINSLIQIGSDNSIQAVRYGTRWVSVGSVPTVAIAVSSASKCYIACVAE